MHRTAICCAVYVLRWLRAVLAVCCAGCALRLYIYTVCNSSLYAVLLYILCLLCAVLAVRFVSIYIYCVQFVTICLLRTQSRQKLCSCVKKKPPTRLNPAETVQPRKRKVGYARNPGRNCAAARSLCRFPARFRPKLYSDVKEKSDTHEKTAETVQLCKETVGCAAKSGRNCAAA